MRLQIGTWFGDGLHHLAHDMLPSGLGLCQCFLKDLIREAVHLDIHLCGGDSIFGAADLEVHIAQVVFITQYI